MWRGATLGLLLPKLLLTQLLDRRCGITGFLFGLDATYLLFLQPGRILIKATVEAIDNAVVND